MQKALGVFFGGGNAVQEKKGLGYLVIPTIGGICLGKRTTVDQIPLSLGWHIVGMTYSGDDMVLDYNIGCNGYIVFMGIFC